MRQRWPERLWIVRHGQGAGNVARAAADAVAPCVPKLIRYNFAAPLIEEAAPITSAPDAMVAAR